MNNKVVYGWFADGELFYVGIGSVKRSTDRFDRNNHCSRKRLKAERESNFEIKIFFSGLTWNQACKKEIELIQQFGRRDLKTGCLTNMTNGGEGAQGYRHTEETKKKIGDSSKGRKQSKETRQKRSISCQGSSHPESKTVHTPLGVFESCRLAAIEHKCSHSVISRRAKNVNFPDYYFV